MDVIVNAFYKGKLDVINIFCIPHHRRKTVKINVVRVWNKQIYFKLNRILSYGVFFLSCAKH